jgi:hypothetical protein
MTIKFPDKADAIMAEVKKINDIDMLIKIKDAIKIAKDGSEILLLIKQS